METEKPRAQKGHSKTDTFVYKGISKRASPFIVVPTWQFLVQDSTFHYTNPIGKNAMSEVTKNAPM